MSVVFSALFNDLGFFSQQFAQRFALFGRERGRTVRHWVGLCH
jgi:hypothetical protein